MFTGIVTELGTVIAIDSAEGASTVTIEAPETVSDATVGASIAVNGVCLTAVGLTNASFTVEIVDESLTRSSLGSLAEGDVVNLERPMPAAGRFDGHIVQGHVDGVGTVVSIAPEAAAARYRISIPKDLSRYVVEKGSIAVDGTSLTVTGVSTTQAQDPWFEIVLIPHTLEVTVLGRAEAGTLVNLEVDVIAKYLERMVGSR
jgi:riboflavin synthase